MTDDNSKSRGCLWGLLVLALLVSLVGLLLIGAWVIQGNLGRKEVDSRLARLQANGDPIDNKTLDEWYRKRTDARDAGAWLSLLAALDSKDFRILSRGVPTFDPTVENAEWTETGWPSEAATRHLVASTEGLRKQIRELARKRVAVRFPIQMDSVRTFLNHAQQLRQVSRLIDVEFQVAFADRDSVAIFEAIQTQLDLAIAASEDPFFVSHLVCSALRRTGIGNLKQALEHNVLAAPELDRLLQSLPNERLELSHLAEIIKGERAACLPLFLDFKNYPPEIDYRTRQAITHLQSRATSRDVLHFLELMEKFERINVRDMGIAIKEARQIDDEQTLAIKSAGLFEVRDWLITTMVTPACEAAVVSFCDEMTQFRLALHGVAIRSHQAKFGSLPEDLESLKQIGFNYQDWMPIGGKPFGYEKQDGDVVLWGTISDDGTQTSETPPVIDDSSPLADKRKSLRLLLRP